jgi:hypothetical protein
MLRFIRLLAPIIAIFFTLTTSIASAAGSNEQVGVYLRRDSPYNGERDYNIMTRSRKRIIASTIRSVSSVGESRGVESNGENVVRWLAVLGAAAIILVFAFSGAAPGRAAGGTPIVYLPELYSVGPYPLPPTPLLPTSTPYPTPVRKPASLPTLPASP